MLKKKKTKVKKGFTEACLYTKACKEVFDILDELGYQRTNFVYDDETYLWCKDGFYGTETEFNEIPYKCRGNVFFADELEPFLNVAALRNDSDYKQLFTTNGPFKQWILCLDKEFHNPTPNVSYHKATVGEIIEDFENHKRKKQ